MGIRDTEEKPMKDIRAKTQGLGTDWWQWRLGNCTVLCGGHALETDWPDPISSFQLKLTEIKEG